MICIIMLKQYLHLNPQVPFTGGGGLCGRVFVEEALASKVK